MLNEMPQNIEAEKAVLGSCLVDQEYLLQALEILSHDDFYRTEHQKIFKGFQDLAEQQKPVDLVTATTHLKNIKGIATTLAKISDAAPLAVNIKTYSELVKEESTKRTLIQISQKTIDQAKNGALAADLLTEAQQRILHIENIGFADNIKSMSGRIGERYSHWEKLQKEKGITGIPSGLDVDILTGGFHNTDLTIIAARPAMGKTALAMTIGGNMAEMGKRIGFLSLEMSEEQLIDRWASMESRVDGYKFRTGRFEKDDWRPINDAASRFYGWNIFIDDTPGLSYMQARRIGRKMKKLHGVEILFVDYLQLMSGDKQDGRTREVGSISRNMKHMAKELEIPVVVLAQLSRAVENRTDKRPLLSDLRDSGEIEQDADVVMFIYRDEVYNPITTRPGIAEINISKQRNGPIGMRTLAWLKKFTRFENLARQ